VTSSTGAFSGCAAQLGVEADSCRRSLRSLWHLQLNAGTLGRLRPWAYDAAKQSRLQATVLEALDLEPRFRESAAMSRLLQIALGAALVGLPACASNYVFTQSAPGPLAPKPAGCDFPISLTTPEGYLEIGAFDAKGPATPAFDLPSLKESIRGDACNAGADAVVAIANGQGKYIKAIVLRKADQATSKPTPEATPSAESPPGG
jgi:hypothetical protein